MKKIAIAVGLLAAVSTSETADSGLPVKDMLTFQASEIKRGDEPVLPKGALSSLILAMWTAFNRSVCSSS